MFALALSALLLASNALHDHLVGPGARVVPSRLLALLLDVVEIGLVLAVLRYEGVRLRTLGLARPLAVPAIVTVGVLTVALNVIVLGGAVLGVTRPSPGVAANASPSALAVSAVYFYLFAALAEELAFRAYLQNKLIALLGGRDSRPRAAFGLLGASAGFSAIHVPRFLVEGVTLEGMLPALGLLFLTGVGFGLVYELTHNLYLVTLLHGVGNYWPLLVVPATWPNWSVVVPLYALLVWAYRRWASGTPRRTLGVPG